MFTNLSLSADTVPSAADVRVTFDPVVLLFVFVLAAFVVSVFSFLFLPSYIFSIQVEYAVF